MDICYPRNYTYCYAEQAKNTLKILATLEILRKLQPCHCDTYCNCEPTAELPLPLLICKELL